MEPLIRVANGLLLVRHGAQKLFGAFGGGGVAGNSQCLEIIGYAPGFAGALALGSLEFFGGFLLALCLFTRHVAAAVVVLMFEAIRFHWGNGFFWPDGGFEYPLLWGIVALSFVIRGGRPYLLHARLGREV
jgi:putative oxidoreductase